MKPGNSVEEKTLRIGKGETKRGAFSAAASIPGPAVSISLSGQGKSWTRGGSDHTEEPIQYDEGKDQKSNWGYRISTRYPGASARGSEVPGPRHKASGRPAI